MHEPWLDLGLGVSPHTGTTIVACVYDGGVVLGADTRVTTGARRPSHACLHAARAVSGRADRRCRLLAIEPRGPPKGPRAVSRRGAHPSLSVHRAARGGGGERAGTYISNRVSDKITPLADNAFLCRSGSAADTQLVSDYGARDTRARRASLHRVCHLGRPHARPRPRNLARSCQRGPPTHNNPAARAHNVLPPGARGACFGRDAPSRPPPPALRLPATLMELGHRPARPLRACGELTPPLRPSRWLHAVRHFVHQHAMEIGGTPDVKTVAEMAMMARSFNAPRGRRPLRRHQARGVPRAHRPQPAVSAAPPPLARSGTHR